MGAILVGGYISTIANLLLVSETAQPFLSIKNLIIMHEKTDSQFYMVNSINLLATQLATRVVIPLAFLAHNFKSIKFSRSQTMGGLFFNLYRDLLLVQMIVICSISMMTLTR